MGADSDERAVVNPDLKVRGLEGLRVADSSVFPVIPNGNLNAPAIMLAERAADLIKGAVLPADEPVEVYLADKWQTRQRASAP